MKILDFFHEIREHIDEMHLSEIFRKTRNVLGIKQFRLGELIGLTKMQVYAIEKDHTKRMPDLAAIKRFCSIFDYDFQKVYNRILKDMESKDLAIKKEIAESKNFYKRFDTKRVRPSF